MRRILAVSTLLLLALVPSGVNGQWPEGYEPAGEYTPGRDGGLRAARVVYGSLDDEKGFIAFVAYEFEDEDSASEAMVPITQDYEAMITEIWRGEPHLDPASSRILDADEQLVLAGSIRSGIGEERVIQEAVVVVRMSNLLWLGTGSRYDGFTPLTDVLDVLERVIGRSPDREAVLTSTGWIGGLFAMLPTLSDLPEGFTQTEILRAIASPAATLGH